MTATGLGGFVALQGLWAVPWLMQVGGHNRDVAAFHLLLTTLAMVCGFLLTALCVGPLRRRGLAPGRVMTVANVAGLIVMLALWQGLGSTQALWFVLGIVFAVGNLAYAEITSRFAPTLAGRVNTALNLATFVGAFSIQWGYGVMLDGFETAGSTTVDSHRAAFALAGDTPGRRTGLVPHESSPARDDQQTMFDAETLEQAKPCARRDWKAGLSASSRARC